MKESKKLLLRQKNKINTCKLFMLKMLKLFNSKTRLINFVYQRVF